MILWQLLTVCNRKGESSESSDPLRSGADHLVAAPARTIALSQLSVISFQFSVFRHQLSASYQPSARQPDFVLRADG